MVSSNNSLDLSISPALLASESSFANCWKLLSGVYWIAQWKSVIFKSRWIYNFNNGVYNKIRCFLIPELKPWTPFWRRRDHYSVQKYLQNESGPPFCKTGTELALHHLLMHWFNPFSCCKLAFPTFSAWMSGIHLYLVVSECTGKHSTFMACSCLSYKSESHQSMIEANFSN